MTVTILMYHLRDLPKSIADAKRSLGLQPVVLCPKDDLKTDMRAEENSRDIKI